MEALQLIAENAGRQLRHYAYPIPDNSVIDHQGYDEILGRIRNEIASGRIVYLHCGAARAAPPPWSAASSLTANSTMSRIAELRARTRKAIDSCPESAAQHRVLRERAARPDGAAGS